jgi:hypothetical protein
VVLEVCQGQVQVVLEWCLNVLKMVSEWCQKGVRAVLPLLLSLLPQPVFASASVTLPSRVFAPALPPMRR